MQPFPDVHLLLPIIGRENAENTTTQEKLALREASAFEDYLTAIPRCRWFEVLCHRPQCHPALSKAGGVVCDIR